MWGGLRLLVSEVCTYELCTRGSGWGVNSCRDRGIACADCSQATLVLQPELSLLGNMFLNSVEKTRAPDRSLRPWMADSWTPRSALCGLQRPSSTAAPREPLSGRQLRRTPGHTAACVVRRQRVCHPWLGERSGGGVWAGSVTKGTLGCSTGWVGTSSPPPSVPSGTVSRPPH